MKVSDLKFTVELKSTYAIRAKFPSDDVIALVMKRPDKDKNIYKLKISIPAGACKKAQIQPIGFLMANISSCSNGLQILFEENQGDKFKGYAVRPLGAYLNAKQVKKKQKESGLDYMSLYAELTIPFEILDTTRSQLFSNKFCKIIQIGKHHMVADISTGVPIFVPKA